MLDAIRSRLRLRSRLGIIRGGGPRAHQIPARWVRRPSPSTGGRVCLFAVFVQGGRILPHSIDHARAWHDAGYGVVAVVIVGSLDQPLDLSLLDFTDGLLLRTNRGYDFGAWSAAIRSLGPLLERCSTLAIANDSVVGPSAGFGAMLDRVERTDADLIGLVESRECTPHFQSFVLFFKSGALQSRVFRRFWAAIRSGEREYVITNYELTLRAAFEAAGLRTHALYEASGSPVSNPTLKDWRALLAAGFPYLKVQLLRDDPHHSSLVGWRDHAAQSGFDLTRLGLQLGELERFAPSPWAFHVDERA